MANHLSSEKSPYLLQHKDNPVDWYPWGTEALNRAKALGAKEAFVISDLPFYASLGFEAVQRHAFFRKP